MTSSKQYRGHYFPYVLNIVVEYTKKGGYMPSINILIERIWPACICLRLQRGNTNSNDKQKYTWERKEVLVDNNMK